jgi:hypothetical protein
MKALKRVLFFIFKSLCAYQVLHAEGLCKCAITGVTEVNQWRRESLCKKDQKGHNGCIVCALAGVYACSRAIDSPIHMLHAVDNMWMSLWMTGR